MEKASSKFRNFSIFSWIFWNILNLIEFLGYPFRAGIIKCATIEEIEAEKSLIEKDAVRVVIKMNTILVQGFIQCPYFQKQRMEKTLESLRANFNAVRTGRSNPAMLDRIEVCHPNL